ncbi:MULTISPECIES: cupin domain-containing protein [Paenibacillus]|uniref:cupin domain-containing protein n=1 Tax=Paenibacillus TaxID=44249 RepID=UPI0022B8969B|nr:cupin domain-containing protein [Paenibacillus caseinilyticus]MCZ8518427.1 cupin domain-containing protein [Paenibacillus caseinilyticus]
MPHATVDYASPSAQFFFDLSHDLFFRKDARNYINRLSIKDLNTLGGVSLLDIYLDTGNVVEPHIHQNASELVYCIAGAAVVSLINPFTNELLNFPITPGQVANVPQGWWHYEVASTNGTRLLAIFDSSVPDAIFGSDILRLTPPRVWAHTYGLKEAEVKETLAPLTGTTVIGPPVPGQKPLNGPHGYASASPYLYTQPAQPPASYGPYSRQAYYHPYPY